jgi:hypothetical protein
MNWPDERYVRLYTRETAEWRAFCWQAKALLPLMLMRADRSGLIDVKPGAQRPRLLAGLVGLPQEVAEAGLVDLMTDGCVVETTSGFVIRNFIEAQEAEASDAKRAREYRDRRRTDALSFVTKRDVHSPDPQRSVTFRDETVTPSRAFLAVPSVPEREAVSLNATPRPVVRRRDSGQSTTAIPDGGWVERVWRHHQATFGGKGHIIPAIERDLIAARLNDGRSADELCKAINGLKANAWRVRNGQTKLTQLMESDDAVRVAMGWADLPPDTPVRDVRKGVVRAEDMDHSKNVEDAHGNIRL